MDSDPGTIRQVSGGSSPSAVDSEARTLLRPVDVDQEAGTLIAATRPPPPGQSGAVASEPGGMGAGEAGPGEPGARYAPRGVLGAGGMGEVRLYADQRIGREVAMKVVHPSVAHDAELLARFVGEARLQGQLEHPAIVPVYDMGQGAEGSWFTMKRVRGVTLADVLSRLAAGDRAAAQAYTSRRVLSAFVQVAMAMGYAHDHGVVHRDLKPANIMLGDYGEVYVLDWGLGKVVSDHDPLAVTLTPTAAAAAAAAVSAGRTRAGVVMGTPGYMSPEQATGQQGALGPATDVYALGAILFEILALEPLHPLDNPNLALMSIVQGAEARPTVRAPHRDPPPELDAVCARATALDPAARYASASELAREVERFLDGDRDVALRRAMAAEQLERAERQLASGESPAGRAEALRSLNRAIALDPSNDQAIERMAALLLAPPPAIPPEVEAEFLRDLDHERKQAARIGAVAYLAWTVLAPLLLLGGVRSWTAWTLGALLTLVSAVLSAYLAARRRPLDDAAGGLLLACGMTPVALASAYLGPFMLVPVWALQQAIIYATHAAPGGRRAATIAISSLAILVPLAAELLGLVSPSFRFEAGRMVLVPRMVDLPPAMTIGLLVIGNTLSIAIPSVLVARVRDGALSDRRRLLVHLWHLRQLVPDRARQAPGG